MIEVDVREVRVLARRETADCSAERESKNMEMYIPADK